MGASTEGLRARVTRTIVEGAVIFVGVGAALAGQAWFEGRDDRRTERDLLVNALTEARSNLVQTGEIARRVEARDQRLTALASLVERPLTSTVSDSILSVTATMLESAGTRQIHAALDEALEAGNFRLIRDDTVREALSSYRNRVRIVIERFDDYQDWTNREVRSRVIQLGLSRTGSVFSESPELRFSGSVRDLTDSEQFVSLVHDKVWLNSELLRNIQNYAAAVEIVIERLEQGVVRVRGDR